MLSLFKTRPPAADSDVETAARAGMDRTLALLEQIEGKFAADRGDEVPVSDLRSIPVDQVLKIGKGVTSKLIDNQDSRLVFYVVGPKDTKVGEQRHDVEESLLVAQGQVEVHSSDKVALMQPGDRFVIPEKATHYIVHREDSRYIVEFLTAEA